MRCTGVRMFAGEFRSRSSAAGLTLARRMPILMVFGGAWGESVAGARVAQRERVHAVSSEHESSVVQALDKLYEFEREPVSEDKLQPGRYFAALFAGEHVAGTEFTIGALFVAWGFSAFDVFVGLAIGNLMAVLTWTFICAPIAVRTRLTLYWYLRKVAGPGTTAIYNVCNAFLFCILAGCMITVSASAVRIPFHIPPNTEWYPTDFRFVLVVLAVGSVVVVLAILGFKRLAQFAEVCSPWMILMFVAGGIVMLPWLAAQKLEGGAMRSWQDYWTLANDWIWIGVRPDGSAKASFWEVAAFAWVCNLAMHGGLSDMALFRYAKSHWYGLYSAFGMFIGHYLAWIFAGMMGAITVLMIQTGAGALSPSVRENAGENIQLKNQMAQAAFEKVSAAGDTQAKAPEMRSVSQAQIGDIDPGAIAFTALGFAGIIAVIIAGWTTSNPTLYRAGLAMQAVTPGWPRWLVTMVVGVITTVIACFPFVFTKLLDFVGLYGLLLVPVGAIVFTEHWIFPKIGLTQFWCEKKKLVMSWPALISWIAGLVFALVLYKVVGASLFYLFIPTSLVAIVLYIVLASLMGARDRFPETAEETACGTGAARTKGGGAVQPRKAVQEPLTWVSGLVALAALAVCILWPVWICIAGAEGFEARFALFRVWLIVPTLVYFVAGTYWAIARDMAKGE